MDEVLIDTNILVYSTVFSRGCVLVLDHRCGRGEPVLEGYTEVSEKIGHLRCRNGDPDLGRSPQREGTICPPPWSLRRLGASENRPPEPAPSTPILYDSGYESASYSPPAKIDNCAHDSHSGCTPQEDRSGCRAMWPQFRGPGDRLAAPALRRGCRYRSAAGRDSCAGSRQSRRHSSVGT